MFIFDPFRSIGESLKFPIFRKLTKRQNKPDAANGNLKSFRNLRIVFNPLRGVYRVEKSENVILVTYQNPPEIYN